MKQNRKGFTLIELLAVIVILAIIALIATPIILNMINEARRNSAKSSTLGFVDSIEYYAGFSEANTAGGLDLTEYSVPLPAMSGNPKSVTCSKDEDGWDDTCEAFMEAVEKKNKGKAPDEATVVLDEAGKVQDESSFKFGSIECSYTGTDVDSCE